MKWHKIELPVPPSVNQIHRVAFMGNDAKTGKPRGRIVYTKQATEYLQTVLENWLISRPYYGKLANPLKMVVMFYPSTNRRQDIMNREKLLSDALTSAGAWGDDSQIDDFRVVRCEVISGGKVEVFWREMEPSEGPRQFAVQEGLFDEPLPA